MMVDVCQLMQQDKETDHKSTTIQLSGVAQSDLRL